MIYQEVMDKSQKDRFVKHTSIESGELSNVNEDWKDKYVFYSPKIIYGIDFVPEEAQDVFLFITTKTINPLQVSQQMARCRNIRKVFYLLNLYKRDLNSRQ